MPVDLSSDKPRTVKGEPGKGMNHRKVPRLKEIRWEGEVWTGKQSRNKTLPSLIKAVKKSAEGLNATDAGLLWFKHSVSPTQVQLSLPSERRGQIRHGIWGPLGGSLGRGHYPAAASAGAGGRPRSASAASRFPPSLVPLRTAQIGGYRYRLARYGTHITVYGTLAGPNTTVMKFLCAKYREPIYAD